MQKVLDHERHRIQARIKKQLIDLGIKVGVHRFCEKLDSTAASLDKNMACVLSELAISQGWSLCDTVRLVRGETQEDPRPNKALSANRYKRILQGYPHCELMQSIATHCIEPEWKRLVPTQTTRPKNHQSAIRHLSVVVRNIADGQAKGQYIVLDTAALHSWPNIQVSPLGAVEKKGVDPNDEIRLIHDLSFPDQESTNDISLKTNYPTIEYHHVAAVAQRIEYCKARYPGVPVKIKKGDVKGAFRHLMMSSKHVQWMGANVRELGVLIIDVSAPFGWTGSTVYYGVFGGAISWLLGPQRQWTPLQLIMTHSLLMNGSTITFLSNHPLAIAAWLQKKLYR